MKRSTIAILLFAIALAAVPRLESMAASAPAPAPGTIVVPLQAIGGSNQTGSATLTSAGNKTNVVIALNGVAADAVEPAHIHQGTCAKLDPKPTYPLTSVAGGQSATTLNVPLSALQTGGFAINVHQSMTNISTYVACGNIPAAVTTPTQSMGAPTPMPTSPPR
ncbi:MAG TPA: hypothetical protein VFO25_00295 [Candidatus Eremiobacteraceae bacterium]|nr:hypothetical protein [Candidatus Eremiobacteraceae bacterium]